MGVKVVSTGRRTHAKRGQAVVEQPVQRRRPPAPVPRREPGPLLLSILIPTVPGREPKLTVLLANLDAQVAKRKNVELLVLRDNRAMTIGEKRNKMLAMARGDYCVFVDDDDAVSSNYVDCLCDALSRDRPDVLCFTVSVRGYGPEKPCRYHPDFRHETRPTEYLRKPNHLMAWRRELAMSVPFPAVVLGEDTAWAEAIAAKAEKVTTLPQTLYVYQFDPSDNSMTPRS